MQGPEEVGSTLLTRPQPPTQAPVVESDLQPGLATFAEPLFAPAFGLWVSCPVFPPHLR